MVLTTSRHQIPRYLIVEDNARILRAQKLGFSVTNLTGCVNVNKSSINPVICRETFTRTDRGGRKPITMKLEANLINIILNNRFESAIKKGRIIQSFLLSSVKDVEEI